MRMSRRSEVQYEISRRQLPKKPNGNWRNGPARHLIIDRTQAADVTNDELVAWLNRYGFEETRASIVNKLARATMSAHFLLASLAAIHVSQIRLGEI